MYMQLRIYIAVFLSSACFFMAVPLIPLFAASLDAASWLVGPTLAISFVLSALFSPIWAKLAQKYGAKSMMIRASALIVVAYLLSAWSTSMETLFLSRVVAGVASGFVPMATATLAKSIPEESKARGFGWLSAAKTAGALLGPALGGFAVWVTDDFKVAFLTAAIASLLTLAVSLTMPNQEPEAQPTTRLRSGDLRRTRRPEVLSLVLTFFLVFAGTTINLWLPFVLATFYEQDEAAGVLGSVTSGTALAALVLAPVWGRLADRSRDGTILLITILAPVPVVVAMGSSNTLIAICACFVIASVLGSESLALLGAEVSKAIDQDRLGPYFGWSNSVTQAAAALGALAVPLLFQSNQKSPLFLAIVSMSLSCILGFVTTRSFNARKNET